MAYPKISKLAFIKRFNKLIKHRSKPEPTKNCQSSHFVVIFYFIWSTPYFFGQPSSVPAFASIAPQFACGSHFHAGLGFTARNMQSTASGWPLISENINCHFVRENFQSTVIARREAIY